MFVDEKAKGEVRELDAIGKVLMEAADSIEFGGWCQNNMYDGGRMCAVGAIGKAGKFQEVAYAARDQMILALGMPVAKWNDIDGRTKEEVVAKLRAVALMPRG